MIKNFYLKKNVWAWSKIIVVAVLIASGTGYLLALGGPTVAEGLPIETPVTALSVAQIKDGSIVVDKLNVGTVGTPSTLTIFSSSGTVSVASNAEAPAGVSLYIKGKLSASLASSTTGSNLCADLNGYIKRC